MKDGEIGLLPGFELPREDAEEEESERGREGVRRDEESFLSLSRPSEAMSSIKDGSALAIVCGACVSSVKEQL